VLELCYSTDSQAIVPKGKAQPAAPTDAEIRLLLARYKCPVPFHAVRTTLGMAVYGAVLLAFARMRVRQLVDLAWQLKN
jgi:hypothetical protein